MLLKRCYAPDGKTIDHVTVVHTGAKARQNFSHRLVEQGVVDGWILVDDQALVLKSRPEALRYRLLRRPGYYCKSSGERIPISEMAWARLKTVAGDLSRREAQAWLAAHGKGPEDYEVTHAYECELDDAQHETYHAVVGPKGRICAAHTLEG